MRRTDRRSHVQSVATPLLVLALVAISIVVINRWNERSDTSMLTIDTEPTTTVDEVDDDGLRFIGEGDELIANNTIIDTTAQPTYLPTLMPTANNATNAPSIGISSKAQQTNPPSFHPTATSPSRSSQLTYQPSKGAIKPTSSPLKTPSPKQAMKKATLQPSKSPPSSRPTQLPSTLSPSVTPSELPSTTKPVITENNKLDSTLSYHAINGCSTQDDLQPTTCIAAQHTSPISVNCCSGSQSNNNLTCRRPDCFVTSSYITAKEHCEQEGMRLCTTIELSSGECCNKGCGFNRRLSWTGDVCELTMGPTDSPSEEPTLNPSELPSQSPIPTIYVEEPTLNPSKLPSQSPTISTEEQTLNPSKLPTTASPPKQSGTLVSFSSGDRSIGSNTEASTVGIMFEVQAKRDLAITSLSTFTESDNEIWSEVWVRRGRYEGNTANVAGWKRVYFKRSQQYGDVAPLDIVFDDEQVFISEGEIMSFYLVSPGKFLSDQGSIEGDILAEDNWLRLYTGAAFDYGRWEDGCTDDRECVLPARAFNGAISYATATMPPTAQPTPDPFEVQASGLTLREEQWIDGHNVRRKKWHKMYGKKYRPLEWSAGLKDMAQAYADQLASNCGPTVHDSRENREGYGENLASNTGLDLGAGSWGELKSVDSIMTRFVERESTWEPPDNGHFTQVLWYASTHVGCAESTGTKPNGVVCRYQVCRYSRAGNCSVGSFNDGSKEWWMKAVMQNSSPCRPFCPPEGC